MPDLPDTSAPPVFTPVVQPAITEGAPLKVVSEFDPSGDQPDAIEGLVTGLLEEEKDQVLLGVTGSGKTFTIAHTIKEWTGQLLCWHPIKHWRPNFTAK